MFKFVLTWHKTLKEKGLDILEDHGLELFCQVLTRSGDFCIANTKHLKNSQTHNLISMKKEGKRRLKQITCNDLEFFFYFP